MDAREILEKVKSGELSVEEAEGYFRREPFEEMGLCKAGYAQEAPLRVCGGYLLQREKRQSPVAYLWKAV